MEINKLGEFMAGKGDLTFFCTSLFQAFAHAKIACLRDSRSQNDHLKPNSLITEPVILKVKFSTQLWNQVEFVNVLFESPDEIRADIGVIGNISSAYIESVLFCKHGRKLQEIAEIDHVSNFYAINKLRKLIQQRSAEEMILKSLYGLSQNISQKFNSNQLPKLKIVDHFQCLKRKNA